MKLLTLLEMDGKEQSAASGSPKLTPLDRPSASNSSRSSRELSERVQAVRSNDEAET
jgi:hypothetical protein